MALLPFGIAQGRVLVIAPNLEIRRGISTAFDIAGRDCFWASTRVLTDVSHGPYTAVLDGRDANIHDCENSHIVVTNIQQLASRADRWLPAFTEDFFDLIMVDEGHHNVARSWERVFERFPNAKVVSLTAMPFRGDGREIAGEVVYAYPFRTAMVRGYIKQITAVNVAPQEISFTYRGDSRRHTLDEVLQLRDEEWFSRGIALAPECNRSIVDASIQWLQHLRQTGTFHQTSVPRNRLICEPLYLTHYIERAGTGTLDMIRLCAEAGLPEPEYRSEGERFVTAIWRDWLTEDALKKLDVTDRQREGVLYVKKFGKITNSEYQDLVGVARKTAARDLDKLVEKGVLERIGTKRGAHYVLAGRN